MRRRIFIVLFLAIFVAMVGMGIIAPLMAIYAEDLGASGIWLGIIMGSFSFSRLVFMPIVGSISDKTGRKRFIAAGLLVYCLFSLAYVHAWNPQSLALIRLAHGIGSAMVIPIAMAYVGEISEKGKEATSMAVLHLALFLGLACGPVTGALLNDSFGMDSAFYTMACLTAIAFFIVLVFLPASRKSDSEETQDTITYKTALRDNTIRGLLIFRVINAMAFGGLLGFLTIFIFESEVLSVFVDRWKTADPSTWEAEAGVLAAIMLTTNIFLTGVLQIPFGKLADKYNKFILILAGSVVATITLLMMSMAQNFEQMLLIGVVMAVGSAMSMPAASAIMVKKVGKKTGMGTQMGLFNAAMSIGIISGNLTFGIVTDTLGIESIFVVGGLLSAGGTVAFYLLTRKEMKSGDVAPL